MAEKMAGSNKRGLEVSWRWFLILHLSLIINSLTSPAGFQAAAFARDERYGFFSFPCLAFYALEVFLMFLYAVIWQQVLKHMSLNFAVTNMPVTTIYPLLWGFLFFGDSVTPKKLFGALIIIAGIVIGVTGHGGNERGTAPEPGGLRKKVQAGMEALEEGTAAENAGALWEDRS